MVMDTEIDGRQDLPSVEVARAIVTTQQREICGSGLARRADEKCAAEVVLDRARSVQPVPGQF